MNDIMRHNGLQATPVDRAFSGDAAASGIRGSGSGNLFEFGGTNLLLWRYEPSH